MHDNGTRHIHIHLVESGIYRLPCTSVFVTAQLTDVRDLVVLRILEQCTSCWWHFTTDLLPVVKRRCIVSLKLLEVHPLKCTSTTNESIRCTCTESRLNMSGLGVRSSTWNFFPNCHLF